MHRNLLVQPVRIFIDGKGIVYLINGNVKIGNPFKSNCTDCGLMKIYIIRNIL